MTKWQILNQKERDTVKFLKAGTEIDVIVETEPKETTVDGKFGKRKMFIVETKTHGLVYVSQRQFMQIADSVNDKTKGIIHMVL